MNLVDPTGSDWYSIKNEKGDTEYIYSSSIRSKEDLLQQNINGSYIGQVFKKDDKYYSLFGQVVTYYNIDGKKTIEGQLYEGIDALLMRQAIASAYKPTSPWDTEVAPEPKQDFYFGLHEGLTFNFTYNGQIDNQSFVSNYDGTIYRAVDKKNMVLSILSMPSYEEKRLGGYNLGYHEPQWYGCFLIIGHNNYQTIQIQYDKQNSALFWKAYNNLYERYK